MNHFKQLIQNWEDKATHAHDLIDLPIALNRSDLVKIKAFCEVYGLEQRSVIADLMATAIKEAEAAIPYVQSDEVIRIEDGEPVYGDAGRTPAFVEADQKIAKEQT